MCAESVCLMTRQTLVSRVDTTTGTQEWNIVVTGAPGHSPFSSRHVPDGTPQTHNALARHALVWLAWGAFIMAIFFPNPMVSGKDQLLGTSPKGGA